MPPPPRLARLLLALLLADLRARAEEELGPLGSRIVVGRPVRFAHASAPEDEALATGRLREALARAGFTDVVFEFEPVAAAYYYEAQLDHDQRVLVADFGGGTSDFALIEVGPSHRKRGTRTILGSDGVGLAGDALDAKVLLNVVAPMLDASALIAMPLTSLSIFSSFIRRRMYKDMPTKKIESKNGNRQPHLVKVSGVIAFCTTRMTANDTNSPSVAVT